VKALAVALGVDLVGICPARATPQSAHFGAWLARGYAGKMEYLGRSAAKRQDPEKLFPGARSMIVVGLVYDPGGAQQDPRPGEARGTVARYAVGDDYHEVLGDRLRALAAGLEALLGESFESRVYVDTGPVLERVAAAYAGIGWVGKNTCLIHPDLGSYLFLGVLVTDLELEADGLVEDRCGSCSACLDACPTDALEAPRLLNATRCIAYTTIEDPGPIPEALRVAHGKRVYGCDICQEVCPWNDRRARKWPADPLGLRARLESRADWARPSLAWILDLDERAWQQATRTSAMRRSKRRGLLRNALVAAGNSRDESLRPQVERLAADDDPLLAEHARWAIERLDRARAAGGSGGLAGHQPGRDVPGAAGVGTLAVGKHLEVGE
jgi:epoxyqueuosine reductase